MSCEQQNNFLINVQHTLNLLVGLLMKWKKKLPKSYLNNWYLFQLWLLDPKLNIQIKCLVNFAEHFYEPLMHFLIGQDKIPRIYQNNQLNILPPGRRAHKMPDKVYVWYKFLQELTKNFEIFFSDELLEALDNFTSEEFGIFFNSLEKEIIKSLKYYEKWFLQWLHYLWLFAIWEVTMLDHLHLVFTMQF
ncbi:hypothetical protein C2G38_1694737 [Gigaspora rosea]|uniref:Uncharacterized protein n=1 Tax=Gigaspora rosea TaxID=44941 RepID=A0A397W8S4_9GLOM|nr:hypothetical protein C2G38_1694737 [Gigaspora rosea]